MSYLFTSEAVTKGHPDKVCDQIADAILTSVMSVDPYAHVACEVCATTGTIILMGEITTDANINYKDVARVVLRDIGYVNPDYGIDYFSCSVIDLIDKQSAEINNAVNNSVESRNCEATDYDAQGAGDQGIIFGYACNETEECMPLSIYLAHKLARSLEENQFNSNNNRIIRPDGKTQVTVKYDSDGNVIGIDTILISTQHEPSVLYSDLYDYVYNNVIKKTIDNLNYNKYITDDTKYIINPSGSFIIGGPQGDTGLTGRKLAVDTYGGHAKFGGGALCGKDPSKVDRSAAYMARYIAKHLVASKICNKAEIQISYGIGIAKPISVNVFTEGSIMPDDMISSIVCKVFDMRPAAIIDNLKLKNFDYTKVSGTCQFGNNFAPWEIIDNDIINVIKNYYSAYIKSYCVN